MNLGLQIAKEIRKVQCDTINNCADHVKRCSEAGLTFKEIIQSLINTSNEIDKQEVK